MRIFNTYGPRMHPNDGRVVSNLIMQALKGEDLTLYGDGSQTRAFCYVDDLVDAMVGMMATGPEQTGPINIGNPGEFSIQELADAILDLTGSKSAIVRRPLPPTIRASAAPISPKPRRCWIGSPASLCAPGSPGPSIISKASSAKAADPALALPLLPSAPR